MKLRKVLAGTVAAVLATTMATVASAEVYNGYVSFQDTVYSFRNSWTEASYGKATSYFDKVIVWGGNDPEAYPELVEYFDYDIEGYVFPVNYEDAVIEGDGTYTVSINDFDWALDGASSFNLLTVNTDIPLDSGAAITKASIIVDGNVTAVYENPLQNPDDNDYVCALLANIWNPDVESYADAYPTESLAIEFTVEGLGAAASDDAAADTTTDDAATTDTTAATGDKTTPDTGVEGVAAVAGLAIVAAGAVIVSKKRK